MNIAEILSHGKNNNQLICLLFL